MRVVTSLRTESARTRVASARAGRRIGVTLFWLLAVYVAGGAALSVIRSLYGTQAKPVVRHGRTFIPLTRRPGGVQAFKIVIPPHDPPEPYQPQVHEGYEWIYVLSGRLHLVLDRREIDLGPGEVVEFDTRTPHVVANRGDIPAEILGLFGPQGERMHVRSGQ